MEREIKAEEKAVVPMGSPITLGQQPNNLHRPKVDWWSKDTFGNYFGLRVYLQ